MTICVSVKVAEGLVLAADSMLTVTEDTEHGTLVVQSWASATKVAQFKNYPVGVMTWGLAHIGGRSIPSLISECEYEYPEIKEDRTYTVAEIAANLVSFIQERYVDVYGDADGPGLGLYIGGFSHREFFATQVACEFPTRPSLDLVPEGGAPSEGAPGEGSPPHPELVTLMPDLTPGEPQFGSHWFGQDDAANRLFRGWGQGVMEYLGSVGVKDETLEEWASSAATSVTVEFGGMPVPDAVDFATWVVDLTIGYQRFGRGIPTCGGAVDIAVLTPGSFGWVARKRVDGRGVV